ncbi:MAG: hypothetical protein WEB79_00225 [Thermoleophilaceae bacterium]
MSCDGRGVRLADVRLPRFWPLSLIGALLLARLEGQHQERNAARIGRELAESVVVRWKQNDEATAATIALTRTLARLTWVLVFVGFATLAVAVIALAR